MLFAIRQVSIMPGKALAARAFAAEVTEYIRGAHKLELEVARPIGGNPMRVSWIGRYKDLAAYEDALNKLTADKRFAELTAKTADIFVPGTMRDELWQSS